MRDFITYRERRYKYQLVKDYSVQTNISGYEIDAPFFSLTKDGLLTGKAGYAWDGPSGPTFDTPDFMRGSLMHDILYQMMREKLLPQGCKICADELLQRLCLEDGMSKFRAHYVFEGVQRYGDGSCAPGSSESEIKTAP